MDDGDEWIYFGVRDAAFLDGFKDRESTGDDELEYQAAGIIVWKNFAKWTEAIVASAIRSKTPLIFTPVVYEHYPVTCTLHRSIHDFDYKFFLGLGKLVHQLEVVLDTSGDTTTRIGYKNEFDFDIQGLYLIISSLINSEPDLSSEHNLLSLEHWIEESPFNFDPWDFDVQWEAGLYQGDPEGISQLIQSSPAYRSAMKEMDRLAQARFDPTTVFDSFKTFDTDDAPSKKMLCLLAELLTHKIDIAEQVLEQRKSSSIHRVYRLLGDGTKALNQYSLSELLGVYDGLLEALGESDIQSLAPIGNILSDDHESLEQAMGAMADLYSGAYIRLHADAEFREKANSFCEAFAAYLLKYQVIDDAVYAELRQGF